LALTFHQEIKGLMMDLVDQEAEVYDRQVQLHMWLLFQSVKESATID
jgi:hypothetical protein